MTNATKTLSEQIDALCERQRKAIEEMGMDKGARELDRVDREAAKLFWKHIRLFRAAPRLLAACEAVSSGEMLAAYECLEYGPGGTTAEADADVLIAGNLELATVAIAAAKGDA